MGVEREGSQGNRLVQGEYKVKKGCPFLVCARQKNSIRRRDPLRYQAEVFLRYGLGQAQGRATGSNPYASTFSLGKCWIGEVTHQGVG